MASGEGGIGPTAHYTGEVWQRAGLSHPWLSTSRGRAMFDALHPAMAVSTALGGPSLEAYLLARHRALDALLAAAVERHGITQVVEIAAGMSPRGWRFANRYGDRVTYVEGDLPAMAQRKRRALERIGSLSEHHRVVTLDALARRGPNTLEQVAAGLDPERGLAVVTEGLLGYLPTGAVLGLWRRIAGTLDGFAGGGRYLSDLHLRSVQSPVIRAFRLGLAAFVRGGVYLHFDGAADAEDRLREAGFAGAVVRPAGRVLGGGGGSPGGGGGDGGLAHILEASTR